MKYRVVMLVESDELASKLQVLIEYLLRKSDLPMETSDVRVEHVTEFGSDD